MFVGHLYLFNFIIYFFAIPVLAFFTKAGQTGRNDGLYSALRSVWSTTRYGVLNEHLLACLVFSRVSRREKLSSAEEYHFQNWGVLRKQENARFFKNTPSVSRWSQRRSSLSEATKCWQHWIANILLRTGDSTRNGIVVESHQQLALKGPFTRSSQTISSWTTR